MRGDSRRFLGHEASNDSEVIENIDFQGFWILRLWQMLNLSTVIYMFITLQLKCTLESTALNHSVMKKGADYYPIAPINLG